MSGWAKFIQRWLYYKLAVLYVHDIALFILFNNHSVLVSFCAWKSEYIFNTKINIRPILTFHILYTLINIVFIFKLKQEFHILYLLTSL